MGRNYRGYTVDNTVGGVCIYGKGKTSSISGTTRCVLEGRHGIESFIASRTMSGDIACFLVIYVTSWVVVINIAS